MVLEDVKIIDIWALNMTIFFNGRLPYFNRNRELRFGRTISYEKNPEEVDQSTYHKHLMLFITFSLF